MPQPSPTHSIRIRVKGNLPGYHPEQVVRVSTDEHGTPLDAHWRRRMKDSEFDGCLEVVETVKTKHPEPKAEVRTTYNPPKKKAARRSPRSDQESNT